MINNFPPLQVFGKKIAHRCCVLRAGKWAGKRPTVCNEKTQNSFVGVFAAPQGLAQLTTKAV